MLNTCTWTVNDIPSGSAPDPCVTKHIASLDVCTVAPQCPRGSATTAECDESGKLYLLHIVYYIRSLNIILRSALRVIRHRLCNAAQLRCHVMPSMPCSFVCELFTCMYVLCMYIRRRYMTLFSFPCAGCHVMSCISLALHTSDMSNNKKHYTTTLTYRQPPAIGGRGGPHNKTTVHQKRIRNGRADDQKKK